MRNINEAVLKGAGEKRILLSKIQPMLNSTSP